MTSGTGGRFIFSSGCSGGPGTADTGRFACTAVSLRSLIRRAWNVRDNQVAGPGALDSAQYDLEAKVPEGTTKDQLNQMLQTLITDRFHLVVHHEERQQEVYELSIAKGGHKLRTPQPGDTETPRDALKNNIQGDGKAQTTNSFDDSDMSSKAKAMLGETRSQVTMMMAGRAGSAGAPSHIASSFVNGLMRLAGRRATIADLTGFLSSQLGSPVNDHTQLTGEWNFDAEYASEGRIGNAQMTMAVSQIRQSMSGGDSAASSPDPSTPSGGLTMTAAFQKQLGLKLEVTKGPADTVVVDKFDKTPEAN
jgi:uncharacterized protein (TIGR03435 family)